MRTMKLPGFSADRGLNPKAARPRSRRPARRTARIPRVTPAAAIHIDGRYVCDGEVTETGFIDCAAPGGGGPSEPRDLVCGPCIRGRQRCGLPGLGFRWGPCID